MDKIVIKMQHSKSTKGTHVYANQEADIPTLYIKKSAFPADPPKEIVVTISEE